MPLSVLLPLLLLSLSSPYSYNSLDSSSYVVELSDEPYSGVDPEHPDGIHRPPPFSAVGLRPGGPPLPMTTRNGERFLCRVQATPRPPTRKERHVRRVAAMLARLRSYCFRGGDQGGWWKYELCPGRHAYQYHEDTPGGGAVHNHSLGAYDPDGDAVVAVAAPSPAAAAEGGGDGPGSVRPQPPGSTRDSEADKRWAAAASPNPPVPGEVTSPWASFWAAKRFIRTQKLKSTKAWLAYCKTHDCPSNIPGCSDARLSANPASVYRDHGWVSMSDWLGCPDADVDYDSFSFDFDVDASSSSFVFVQTYRGGADGRSAVARFSCDESVRAEGRITAVTEPDENNAYEFHVATPAMCSGALAVPPLLAPLRNVCMTKVDGWWTFEVCPFRHVRQYHEERLLSDGNADVSEGASAGEGAGGGAGERGDGGGEDGEDGDEMVSARRIQRLKRKLAEGRKLMSEFVLGKYDKLASQVLVTSGAALVMPSLEDERGEGGEGGEEGNGGSSDGGRGGHLSSGASAGATRLSASAPATAGIGMGMGAQDRPAFREAYAGGTPCDLTGRGREAEVWYTCDHDAAFASIESVVEVETCRYVATVATPLLCNHSAFNAAELERQQMPTTAIKCSPA